MARDEILEETRRIRDAMAKAYGYDVKKFVRAIQHEQVKRGRHLVTLPSRRLSGRGGTRVGDPGHKSEATVATVGPNDNVFAALNLPDADQLLVKAELARAIRRQVEKQRLSQKQAGAALSGTEAQVSNLARGRVGGHSLERLVRCLNALGLDVDIIVRHKPRTRGRATVRAFVRGKA